MRPLPDPKLPWPIPFEAVELIADADTATVLSGGWYFATEVARVINRPGLIRVGDGAGLLKGSAPVEGAG